MRFDLKPFFMGLVFIVLIPSSLFAASFEYLYVEASEGNSSGGHSAIEFGDEVYHFQHHDSGLIRLLMQDKQEFHFQYRFLQNRRIHLSHIEVTDETFARLRSYFKLQFLAQNQQFNQLNQLHKDRLLLRRLLYKINQDNNLLHADFATDLQLKGAGLFFAEQQLGSQSKDLLLQSSPVIKMLRKKIEQRYGPDFLDSRKEQITTHIKILTPTHWPEAMPVLSKDNFPAVINFFADSYTDYITGLVALKVLQEEQNLQPGAFFVTHEVVTLEERWAVEKLSDQLTSSLLASVSSNRLDWGYATLINLSRIMVLERTLQLGLWVFLDDYSQDSEWVSADQFAGHAKQMQIQLNDAKINLEQTRKELLTLDDLSEARYSQVEMAANRYFEMLKVARHKNIRYIGEKALPTKSVSLPAWQTPELSEQNLTMALSELDTYENKLLNELNEHYRYDLISRNCVTELFRTIDQGLLPPQNIATNQVDLHLTESTKRLGGNVSADYNFIPFISFQAVQENYKVITSKVLHSYRDQELAKLYAKNDDLMVSLREANTLTSTIYTNNPDDAFFVFFTDDHLVLRPVFGLVNTAAGIGQSVFGFLSWPFDTGKNLKSGATGILMSLPELLFFNIRKGSYKYLSYKQFVTEGQ